MPAKYRVESETPKDAIPQLCERSHSLGKTSGGMSIIESLYKADVCSEYENRCQKSQLQVRPGNPSHILIYEPVPREFRLLLTRSLLLLNFQHFFRTQ